MGLSVSDAVGVLLTRVAAEKALPFEVKARNAATAAAMREARKGGLPSFSKVSDLMADLHAEGADARAPRFSRVSKRGISRLQALPVNNRMS